MTGISPPTDRDDKGRGLGSFSQEAKIPTVDDGQGVSNARLIAELQAVTIGIHLVGLDRLPTVMGPCALINGA